MKNLFLTITLAFALIFSNQAFSSNIITGEPATAPFVDPANASVPDGETLNSITDNPYTTCDKLGHEWCKAQGEALISYSKKVESVRENHVKSLYNNWKSENPDQYDDLKAAIEKLEVTHESNVADAYSTRSVPTMDSVY
jgi:hypothetical protein